VTYLVAFLGEGDTTPLTGVRPVVDVHAGVVHHVAELGEPRWADRALKDLIHATSSLIQGVGLVEHVACVCRLLRLVPLHFLTHEVLKLLSHSWVQDTNRLTRLFQLFGLVVDYGLDWSWLLSGYSHLNYSRVVILAFKALLRVFRHVSSCLGACSCRVALIRKGGLRQNLCDVRPRMG